MDIALEQLSKVWQMLQNEHLVSKLRFDTAEHELSEVDIEIFADFCRFWWTGEEYS